MSPLFDNDPFSVNGSPSADGKSVKLWAATNSGELAMMIDVSLN
jgi:hydroxyacyl-ACP dehydratase HTD2-like protein with hotdog domain